VIRKRNLKIGKFLGIISETHCKIRLRFSCLKLTQARMFGLNGGVPFRNLINNNNQHSSGSIASGFAPLPGNTRTCNGDNVDNSRAALRMDRNCAASNSPPSSIQYRYEAPWNLYAMNWSVRKDQDKKFRLAVGSYQEGPQQGHDTVQIVQLQPDTGLFDQVASFEHNHPANKIAWIPDIHGSYPDLLATSGDYLRIWKLNSATTNSGSGPGPGIELALILNNVNSSSTDGRQCLPLTSFDWNQADPSILVTASLDNSCTVWTLDTGQAISQSSKSSKKLMSSQSFNRLIVCPIN
jgi:WD40 repeat protein